VIAVQRCDEIIVLEEGRVTARGTHQTLLAQPGYYRTIALAQMDHRERS
jgi:ABC-type multidrug transport system fused ATPase/permease subunit